MRRYRHRPGQPRRYMGPTSPEGYEIKRTAALAYKGSAEPVIGPGGEILYGAAAATYLHHRGQLRGIPYDVPRYGTKEWSRRRELATKHARSR